MLGVNRLRIIKCILFTFVMKGREKKWRSLEIGDHMTTFLLSMLSTRVGALFLSKSNDKVS